jgi:hypothetical protein
MGKSKGKPILDIFDMSKIEKVGFGLEKNHL